MSPIIYSNIRYFFCILLTGFVIKFVDDYIDREKDYLIGQKNIFNILDDNILPYIFIIYSVACYIDRTTAVTLFLASFSLGMIHDFTAKMPTLLYGYQESIILIALSVLIIGIKDMLSSLLIIASIHLIDDLIDVNKEIYIKKNWAFLLGKVETLTLSIIFFLLSVYINLYKTLMVLIATPLVVYIINLSLTKLENCSGKEGIKYV